MMCKGELGWEGVGDAMSRE
jgi:hypothetical protein